MAIREEGGSTSKLFDKHSTYKDVWVCPKRFLFVAEEENLQAFVKVLTDIQKTGGFSVTLVYFAKTVEDIMYRSELEFFARQKNWIVKVYLSEPWTVNQKIKDDANFISRGLPSQIDCFKSVPTKEKGTETFISVHLINRVEVASVIEKLGYASDAIRWVQ